jgi:hypothetical protein
MPQDTARNGRTAAIVFGASQDLDKYLVKPLPLASQVSCQTPAIVSGTFN